MHESFNVGRNALGLLKTTGKKKSVTALRAASVYNRKYCVLFVNFSLICVSVV